MSPAWLAAVNAFVLMAGVVAVGTQEQPAPGPAAAPAAAPVVQERVAPAEPVPPPATPAPAAPTTPAPSPSPEPPPSPPRATTVTGWQPYASAGPVVLHAPGEVVEVIGYHQSGHDGAVPQLHAPGPVRAGRLESRSRDTHPQGAADLVLDPAREVRSPVTGTVVRAGTYTLYCDHVDQYLVVEPDARPGWEVKVLHVQGLAVATGDRVEGGVTVVASGARPLPFRSQVDDVTVAPHWPHVHVEVVDPAVPDRPSGRGCD